MSMMLTIKASSRDEAMKIARTVKGFKVDEHYGALLIDPKSNEYVVRGTVANGQQIVDTRVETWAHPPVAPTVGGIPGCGPVTYTPKDPVAPSSGVKYDDVHTLPATENEKKK